jgi:hypothetical protein
MPLPTEPVGSIPRPRELIDAVRAAAAGELSQSNLAALYDSALRDTITRLEATGSPVITDGEQTKPSFATYPLAGLENLALDGVEIPFEDGHVRRLPRLTAGPFRYGVHADGYLQQALRIANVPVKHAVIAPSALSLLYPPEPIESYSREAFLADLADEAEADVRRCLDAGAHKIQLDFTEGRLSIKLDPSKALLGQFIELNNRVLERFSAEERSRIGIHTLPRRRSGLDPQPGRAVRRAAADPVHAEGRELLHPARERKRPAECARGDSRARPAGPAHLHRRHRPDRPQGRRAGRGARPDTGSRRVHSVGPSGQGRAARSVVRCEMRWVRRTD